MSTSLDLQRPTGQKLIMFFNQDGALSKATLISPQPRMITGDVPAHPAESAQLHEDVTGSLRYVRRDDAVALLQMRGFVQRIDATVLSLMPVITVWAERLGYFPFLVTYNPTTTRAVALLSDQFDHGVHPVRIGMATFSRNRAEPVRVELSGINNDDEEE